MRLMIGMAAVVALTGFAQAADANRCLRWSDIDTVTRAGPNAVLVRTRSKAEYEIAFSARCDYQRSPQNFFVVRYEDRLSCIAPTDAFNVNQAATCIISSINARQNVSTP